MEKYPGDIDNLRYMPEVTPGDFLPVTSPSQILAEHGRARFVMTRGALLHAVEVPTEVVDATDRHPMSYQALNMAGGLAAKAAFGVAAETEGLMQDLTGTARAQHTYALAA